MTLSPDATCTGSSTTLYVSPEAATATMVVPPACQEVISRPPKVIETKEVVGWEYKFSLRMAQSGTIWHSLAGFRLDLPDWAFCLRRKQIVFLFSMVCWTLAAISCPATRCELPLKLERLQKRIRGCSPFKTSSNVKDDTENRGASSQSYTPAKKAFPSDTTQRNAPTDVTN